MSIFLASSSIWMWILLYQEYATLQCHVDVLFGITQKRTGKKYFVHVYRYLFLFQWGNIMSHLHYSLSFYCGKYLPEYRVKILLQQVRGQRLPPRGMGMGAEIYRGVRPALYQRRALVASLAHTRTDQLSWTPLPVATTSAADTLTGADFCFHAIPI